MGIPANNSLEYIALGDFLTVGVGRSLFDPGFVELYARYADVDLKRCVRTNSYNGCPSCN